MRAEREQVTFWGRSFVHRRFDRRETRRSLVSWSKERHPDRDKGWTFTPKITNEWRFFFVLLRSWCVRGKKKVPICSTPSSNLKVGNILVKGVSMCINLNIDSVPITQDLTLTNHNVKPLVFSPGLPPIDPVYDLAYVRCVDLWSLDFSLSSHRHSYISFLFSSRFIT